MEEPSKIYIGDLRKALIHIGEEEPMKGIKNTNILIASPSPRRAKKGAAAAGAGKESNNKAEEPPAANSEESKPHYTYLYFFA